jgi:N-formylglutamate amidohydrolase
MSFGEQCDLIIAMSGDGKVRSCPLGRSALSGRRFVRFDAGETTLGGQRIGEVVVAPDDFSCGEPEGAASVRAPSFSVLEPPQQTVPLVFASPHSGRDYPRRFVASSRLRPLLLRRSEDAFVDRIFASAPSYGAPLLRALFPRVYIDPNREPFELDPAMFDAPLPDYVNASSPRVAAGLGTIARVVANGEEVYRDKLSFEEVRQRIEAHYFPYHRALRNLLASTRERFGCYLLVDCHSMPSVGGPMDADPGLKRLDIVLGDCHGTSCAAAVIELAERTLRGLGFTVRRNLPYAGGYTTRRYGNPREGLHTLQIEVNRALYMDEHAIAPNSGLSSVIAAISTLIGALSALGPQSLKTS